MAAIHHHGFSKSVHLLDNEDQTVKMHNCVKLEMRGKD